MAATASPPAGRGQLEDERPARPRPPSSARSCRARPDLSAKVDLMICPPATLIMTFAAAALAAPGSRSAARTATPSRRAPSPATFPPRCWPTLGASAVIVGHSERRTLHQETDAEVRAKAQAAWRAGPDRDRLHRRDPRRARGGQDARRARPPARRLAAGRRDRGQSGGRLRAGLGDRHRPDADRGRRRARPTPSSASGSSSATARPGKRCAFSTAARSSRRTPRN